MGFDAIVSVRNERQNKLVTFQEGALKAFHKLQECTVLPHLPCESGDMDVDRSLPEPVIDGMVVSPDEMLTPEIDVSSVLTEKNVVVETETTSCVTAVAG